MEGYAPPIKRLIEELARLPGIGEKTAMRLALHILASPREEMERLAESILAVKDSVRLCSVCFNLSDTDPCRICSNGEGREESICVVENINDLLALERAGFRGRYHVLHGLLSPIKGVGPDDIRVKELVERVKRERIREVIVATNPDAPGEATALYIARLLRPLGVKVTRIAYGVPMGGDIEYIDELTLSKAIEGRREL